MFNQMSHYVTGATPIWARLIDRFGWVEKLNAQEYREDLKQFLFGLATIKGLPFYGTVEDGNTATPSGMSRRFRSCGKPLCKPCRNTSRSTLQTRRP